MADKRKYTFIEKEESKDGLFSLKLALAAAALFVLDLFISFLYRGEAGAFTGAIALTALLLAIYGFRVGLGSFSDREKSPVYPAAGTILGGIVMLGYAALYLSGM